MTYAPEPWDPRWPCEVDTFSPTATGQAVQGATEILHALTGRQYGLQTVTLRPCRRDCADVPWGWTEWPGTTYPQPALIGGLWFNLTCGSCPGSCACASLSEVTLPAPVHSVTTVRLDGSAMATGSYMLYDARTLVRTDGDVWPRCQNLVAADTQDGTWSITARYGQEVPVLGELAVGELACELLRAMNGDDCRLPANVTSLARQGVTIQMPDPTVAFEGGLTGLWISDNFIRSTNPNRLPARSRVYSVDRPASRRAT